MLVHRQLAGTALDVGDPDGAKLPDIDTRIHRIAGPHPAAVDVTVLSRHSDTTAAATTRLYDASTAAYYYPPTNLHRTQCKCPALTSVLLLSSSHALVILS